MKRLWPYLTALVLGLGALVLALFHPRTAKYLGMLAETEAQRGRILRLRRKLDTKAGIDAREAMEIEEHIDESRKRVHDLLEASDLPADAVAKRMRRLGR